MPLDTTSRISATAEVDNPSRRGGAENAIRIVRAARRSTAKALPLSRPITDLARTDSQDGRTGGQIASFFGSGGDCSGRTSQS
jgi:hypothetical protein